MVRITKVYTKTGDQGTTALAGGQRLAKDAPRICAYGTVDELNAALALVAEALRDQAQFAAIRLKILRVQNELFDLGSQLAVLASDRRSNTPVIAQAQIIKLEEEIDLWNEQLQPLRSFILPGGGEIAARVHLARTICRRAEREVVHLSSVEAIDGPELIYLNRLSDWLFVLSRTTARMLGIEETLWQPQGSPQQ